MSSTEKKEMVENATVLAEKFIKQHYNTDFVLKDYEIMDSSISSTLYLRGYITGHEDVLIYVYYDYRKKEISGAGGPSWFIDSGNPKKHIPSPSSTDSQ
ncbi:hypothetical protein J2T13_000994 [Paenibacillus sp. DS2015]|uniref:hypothetical protein n=1 Tax=Paenibacillus sp. DS2015 TaxID=3373917 RepID=UPI003D23C16D